VTLQVVVVTGMSGAGRSTALHVLEDLGYYCVDNLPPALAGELVALTTGSAIERLGLGIDVRTGAFLEGADVFFSRLRDAGHRLELLFVDCADEVLVRRYSETRRPHPLAPGGDLLDAIHRERQRLSPLRAQASHVLDTSELSVHALRRALLDWLAQTGSERPMVVRVVSFGFKYGLPVDADLVFDLRFLPNPYFVPELKARSGLDSSVADYVLQTPEAQELLGDIERLLRHTLPRYEREGKAYLTIALGCTGGRHRSVALSEELARRLRDLKEARVVHRDVERKGSVR